MSEINNEVVVDDKTTVEEPVKTTESKTFTQEELDKIVADRLSREKKKLEKYADYDEVKTKLTEFEKFEEERKKAEMTVQERLEAEKAEADKRAQESEERANKALEQANKRLLKAEFRLLAKELGVRKDALDDAFVLADMTSVEVDEEGNVLGVKEALETLKKAKAYLFGGVDYADPSPGQYEAKREGTQDQAKRKLEELAQKAKKSGRIEDKIAYASFKKELGL
ncbi:scaffolding protein [Neobacillus niacini]|uniref:phage scaffolding protein n=1 Tax=Neobacillus niacini TaxID=86668 RepID=UPI003000A4D8